MEEKLIVGSLVLVCLIFVILMITADTGGKAMIDGVIVAQFSGLTYVVHRYFKSQAARAASIQPRSPRDTE